ncbi:MAG: GerAB/ArcD/ProY family transporter [Oscillospiraceae bacterium]|nr:GerAB/ArcD/ProY family transporter [Oscillospiraceae bacterium]
MENKCLPSVKIGNFQLASLFIMTRMFSDCLNFPVMVSKYGMQRLSVMLISYVVIFALYIPAIILSRRFEGESVFSLFATKCRPLFYIVAPLFILLMLFQSVLTGASLEFFVSNTLMNTISHILAILLLTVVAVYGVAKGLSALVRIAPLLLTLFVTAVVLGIISSFGNMYFYYLYPSFVDTPATFWDEVRLELSKNAELFAFLVLCRFSVKKAQRAVYMYLPGVLLLSLLMFTVCLVLLGPGLNMVSFPYNRAAMVTDLVVLERLDGLDMFIWIIAAVLKIVMFMSVVRNVIVLVFKERAAKMSAAALTVISGGLSYFVAANRHFLMSVDLSWAIIAAMLVFGVVCPIIAMFLSRVES